jgi:hypothetical protein
MGTQLYPPKGRINMILDNNTKGSEHTERLILLKPVVVD